MIEYLYNAIRATAGEEIVITAKISNDNGEEIKEGCHLGLYSEDEGIAKVHGEYIDGLWHFTLKPEDTANFRGRFWYCVCDANNNSYCFKQPIYLV